MIRKIERNAVAVDFAMVDDRLAVRPDKADEKTAGGIVLVEEAQEKPCRGIVVATGPGKPIEGSRERLPLLVKVGNYVAYQKYNSVELDYEGEKLIVMRQTEVLAILPEPKD